MNVQAYSSSLPDQGFPWAVPTGSCRGSLVPCDDPTAQCNCTSKLAAELPASRLLPGMSCLRHGISHQNYHGGALAKTKSIRCTCKGLDAGGSACSCTAVAGGAELNVADMMPTFEFASSHQPTPTRGHATCCRKRVTSCLEGFWHIISSTSSRRCKVDAQITALINGSAMQELTTAQMHDGHLKFVQSSKSQQHKQLHRLGRHLSLHFTAQHEARSGRR